MPKKVVVTGAAGFIGRQVTKCLHEAGHHVIGVGRSEMNTQDVEARGLVNWIPGGVSIDTLMDYAGDVEEIYHCAGSGSVAISLKNPSADFSSNVSATQIALEFARLSGGKKFIYLSSAGAYGFITDLPITVGAPCNPISPYGINKRIGELLVQQYAQHFNVPSVIIRLFSVYGAGLRKQLLWDASNKLLKGDFNFFGTGDETRDWIYVEDAARLICAASNVAGSSAPILNGGTGQAIKIHEIIEGLARRYGISDPIEFSGQVRAGDPKHYLADISEALATGWRPQVSLEDGLTLYTDWFKATKAVSSDSKDDH